jgi:hypothetical protein
LKFGILDASSLQLARRFGDVLAVKGGWSNHYHAGENQIFGIIFAFD